MTFNATIIDETIYFLENSTNPPVINGAPVSFTLNSAEEFNGLIFDVAKSNMQGLDIALWELQTRRPLLKNFRFISNPISLGQIIYMKPWAAANLMSL